MTTIISRHYADAKTAKGVVDALYTAGFTADAVTVVDTADADMPMAARLSEAASAAYADAMKKGSAVVVVNAPFTPFGAARVAMTTVNSAPSMRLSGIDENRYIREEPKSDLYMSNSVLRSHPRFLSSDMNRRANANRGTMSTALHWKILTKHRGHRQTGKHGPVLPFGTIKHKTSSSAISGCKRMLYNPS